MEFIKVRQRGFSFKITVYVLSYVHLGRKGLLLSESGPGHTGLGKRGPPVVFGSYKGQMLQNNDQQSRGLTRRFDFVCKKDNTPLINVFFKL